MNYISGLHEGEMISEVYFCKSKVTATTKAGKNYYSMQLQDRTGIIDGKVWELNNGISHFDAMDYIKVDAQVTSFNNSLQLNIKRVRIADPGEYDTSDYMPCSEKNTDDMYKNLMDIINGINNKYLSGLLKSFFVDDGEFINKFKIHSSRIYRGTFRAYSVCG